MEEELERVVLLLLKRRMWFTDINKLLLIYMALETSICVWKWYIIRLRLAFFSPWQS